ncbi:hypothetical protein OS187_09080 [Xanthomonadaceae bacterium JHOS43]|nr:hypothetical protein [Xanthomonadaceae bacterium JHOS43]
MTRLLLLLLVVVPALASGAQAAVFSLSHDEAAQRLRVYDDSGIGSAASLPSVGLGVQVGSVTADATGNRVFFVTNKGDEQTLHAISYGLVSGVESAALPDGLRVTHLEWDGSGTQRLVGVGLRIADEAATLIRFQGGELVDLGMPQFDCCTFRAGVSAYRASDDSLFLVGRVDGENRDRIFRFGLGAVPTVASVLLDADLAVLELAVAGSGQVFGLAYSASIDRTRLVAFDALLNVEIRGTGVEGCCFVLAGSSAIDPVAGDWVVAGTGASGVSSLWRFALASGAVIDGITTISAVGLFHDATTVTPGSELFGDGFESGLPLPRALQQSH